MQTKISIMSVFVSPGILVGCPIHDCQSHFARLSIIGNPVGSGNWTGGIRRVSRLIGRFQRRPDRNRPSFSWWADPGDGG